MRSDFIFRLISGALFFALTIAPVAAQIDENATDDEPEEVIEELVVVGTRPGDPVDADPAYREVLRQQMMQEVERMRVEEAQGWRETSLTVETRTSENSRIVWGYDPEADRDMRNDIDFDTMPGETVRPATLFRAEF